MPRGDATGPMGMGPMTGRAAGFCAGNGAPGFTNSKFGCRGLGRGRNGMGGGFGRGFRNMFFATGLPGWMRAGAQTTPDSIPGGFDEKQLLANQAQVLQTQLNDIQARLKQIEIQSEAKT